MPLVARPPVVVLAGALALTVLSPLVPAGASARELALAQGPVVIRDAAAGQRSVSCRELIVEARDALDNHLIARTRPELAEDGSCRYALSVPAQSAVWLRVRAALVADARAEAPASIPATASAERRVSGRAVQLRFTVIAPTTSFFAPGEEKTVPLSY